VKDTDSEIKNYQTAVVILVIVILGLVILLVRLRSNSNGTITPVTTGTSAVPATSDTTPAAQAATTAPEPKVTCRDVTSYDHNWNNDVLCTNPNGSTFYTNYAGGNKYGYSFGN
jgi:hypothetical protein